MVMTLHMQERGSKAYKAGPEFGASMLTSLLCPSLSVAMVPQPVCPYDAGPRFSKVLRCLCPVYFEISGWLQLLKTSPHFLFLQS